MDPVTRRMIDQANEKLRHAEERETILGESASISSLDDLKFAPVGESAGEAIFGDGCPVILPTRAYPDDAGLDLYVSESVEIEPRAFADIHCNIAVELPLGVWALVIGRSSTLRKRKLMVNPGIIDTGYRGELFTGVWNMGDKWVRVEVGERLAQVILFENVTARYAPVAVAALAESERGTKGFGSSGQ